MSLIHPRREMGSTQVEVFPVGLGAMSLLTEGRPSEDQAIKVLHFALDAGVNFIDAANVCCIHNRDMGHNEVLIRKALKERSDSDNVFVATKGGLRRPNGAWVRIATPQELRRLVSKASKVWVLDLFFFMSFMPQTIIFP
jgi:aryl-alcohol dehydrogenase-like predicted oxidoreductase